jgi:hypothetical protein
MKTRHLLLFLTIVCLFTLHAQNVSLTEQQRRDISVLIDQYSLAREKSDTVLLKNILTTDVDQLVSTGEWRTGVRVAVQGMLASSTSGPGTRKLSIHNIKLLNRNAAIVDCRYEIANDDGTTRRMWSSFVVVSQGGAWRISAIRNMLPARP